MRDGPLLVCRTEGKTGNERGVRIVLRRRGNVRKGFEDFIAAVYRLCQSTAPQATLGKCLEIKASDDAEIITATFEGAPEVWSGCGVGIDDGTGCENDLLLLAQRHCEQYYHPRYSLRSSQHCRMPILVVVQSRKCHLRRRQSTSGKFPDRRIINLQESVRQPQQQHSDPQLPQHQGHLGKGRHPTKMHLHRR